MINHALIDLCVSRIEFGMNHRALKLIRQYHRLSQSAVAKKLDLSTSFVSELENGNRNPSIDVLEKYANFYRLPLSSLMLFSEQIESNDAADRSRNFVASKVVKMLEWLEETASEGRAESKHEKAH